MLMQDDQIFVCPHIKQNPPNRVLDAGCGTGIWALDFGNCTSHILRSPEHKGAEIGG